MDTLRTVIPINLYFQIIICSIVIFVSALAETLGLSMVMPLLASLLGEGDAGVIAETLEVIFGESLTLNSILLILVAMFFLKFILGVLKNYMMYGFEWQIRAHWMSQIYQYNTLREYQSFEKTRPGIITNEIINETTKAASALRQILEFIGQGALIIGLLTVILISNLLYSSVFLLIALIFVIIVRFTIMKKVNIYGVLRQNTEGEIYHEVNEMIHGMKTIRFLELESFLFKRFKPRLQGLVGLMRKNETLRRLPSLMIEIIFVVLFAIGLLIASSSSDFDIVTLLPFIGMLALISVKLFTNIGTVVANITAIVNLWVSVETISNLIENADSLDQIEKDKKLIEKNVFEHSVVFKQVSFFYDEGVPILDKLDASFNKGTFNVITGVSGSGKSTLSKILIGLYKPKSGSVIIDDVDIGEISPISLRSFIGYVDQEHFFLNGTILENLKHKLSDISDEKIQEAIKITNAEKFIKDMPDGLNTVIGDKGDFLSTGQKARLAFARALLMDPQILILDEITSSLDKKSSDYIIQTVLELKKKITIIAISHDPLVIDQAENLFELNKLGLKKIN